ncbi:uncharacterized protein C8R40DRAFT_1175495 [Lentinula edodes]|uniref:uncharacterized protein n=1 Tax=Lentinula edodes TaxID=5353 RepID=UPI001E8CF5FE|nr:uncharacterized protein C8R40DRAFT_1175495 [Lentinula edodes]KAH7870475.1 hypothetical protein C8R40DRAFT_1175495 [Lentinula edodes]
MSHPNSPQAMSLNNEQNLVRNVVSEHLQATLSGEKPEPLLQLVHGASGTGKTVLVRALFAVFEAHSSTNLLLTGSASDVAAKTLNAVYITKATLTPTLMANKQYIVIDDCSALSATLLRELALLMGGANDGARNKNMFGLRNVVLFADIAQHPPSGRYWDTVWWPTTTAAPFIKPFFENVQVLQRDMTGSMEVWSSLLCHVRTQCTNLGDVQLLNTRAAQTNGIASMNILLPHEDAIVVTTSDTQRQYWNINFACRFARATRKTLFISPASDVLVFQDGDRLSSDDFDKMKERFKREFTLLRGVYLFVGMIVTITQSELRHVWGEVTEIVVDDRDVVEEEAHDVRLKYGVAQVTVHVSQKIIAANPGMNELVIIKPVMVPFKVPHPCETRREIVIERTQLPLVPRYAITEEDTMGQRFNKVVVDTSSGLSRYKSLYQVLTRVTGLGSLVLTSLVQGLGDNCDNVAAQDILDVIT